MALMPVTKGSTITRCSRSGGDAAWIGWYSVPAGAGWSSMVWPRTLNKRPSVARPTGTRIGCPVSITGRPRRSPAVLPIAMARTVWGSMCSWTSITNSGPSSR